MNCLTTYLGNVKLDNPIIPASGTFGYGHEFSQFYDLNKLGSIAIKGTTINPRYGNELSRIAETASGMLNAVGLQNPGIKKVLNDELIKLAKVYQKQVIANVCGSTKQEYLDCAIAFDKNAMVAILELNVSCPNVECGGISFGSDILVLSELIRMIKSRTKKPLFIKLSPNSDNLIEIAKACEQAQADGLVLVNTLIGMKIDLNKQKPSLANNIGGLSGPAIKPVALRIVYQIYQHVKIPIIGVGGITNATDVLEFIQAGASAVEVGSQNLIDPYACEKIIKQLPKVLKEYQIEKISDAIGVVHE